MITFIIKSSLSLIILFGLYWLLLKNEKLFIFNRYFLVFALIFSLVIPFIYIPVHVQESENFGKALIALDNNIQYVTLNQSNISQGNNSYTLSEPAGNSFISIPLVLFLIYIIGLLLFLIRFLRNINKVIHTIKISEKIPLKGYRIILTDDNPGPHSFFKNIFLNREDYLEGRIDKEMLNHELEHVKQLHSIDIIIVEIVKIIYWFNPVYLLYDRAIRINHEYLADNNAIRDNYNIKNYTEKLFSFIPTANIPLTSGSSHSFTKRRLLMMTKSKSGLFINRLRIATTLFMLAIVFLILGFKVSDKLSPDLNSLNDLSEIQQNVVKGIVLKEDGNPLRLVTVATPTGSGIQTGSDGRFAIGNLQKNVSLRFSCIGYKNQTVKADFTREMVITMEKDPDFKGTVMTIDATYLHEGDSVTIRVTDDSMNQALLVIDGKITDYKGKIKVRRDDIGGGQILMGKEATDRYGEKGKYGVVEIMTKKRADELGIKPREPKPNRVYPEDYPTFQGGSRDNFVAWIQRNTDYPPEAIRQKIQGTVTVNFTIEADGSVSNVRCLGFPNQPLGDAVIKTVRSSPKWEPAKNPEFKEPFNSQVSIKFTLPDRVSRDNVFVVVEEMPSYPGGEEALIKFIYDNLRYPAKAKADSIQGKVILRFVVNKEGNVEDPTVIRSIHPLLDAEAVRVISMLSGWKPGYQGGEPVNVWYSIPITFSLK